MSLGHYTLRKLVYGFSLAVSGKKGNIGFSKDLETELIRIIKEAIENKNIYAYKLSPKEKLSLIVNTVKNREEVEQLEEFDDFQMNTYVNSLSFIPQNDSQQPLTAEKIYDIIHNVQVDGETLLTYFYDEGYNYSFNQYDGSISPNISYKLNGNRIDMYAYYEFLGK